MPRLRSIIIKAVSLLLAAPVISLAYVIWRISRPPANNPEKFLQRGGRASLPPEQRLVVCLGASIVHGRVCPNFVDLAASRLPARYFTFVNAGVNGDTSYHVLKRLDQVIACDPDYVIILAGTNDVICTLIPGQWRMYRGSKRLAAQPTLETYRANMREIVRRLHQETRARVAICSLPLLGEDLTAPGDRRVSEFNAALKQLCDEEQAAYLPVHEEEASLLAGCQQRDQVQGKPFRPQENDIIRYSFLGAIRHYLLGQSWDQIGRSRGMALKNDMIHGTSAEVDIIAGNLVTFLNR